MERRAVRERGATLRRRLGIELSDLGRAVGLEDLVDEMMFGGVWGRGGLDVPDRLVCTLTTVTLLGRTAEIETWTRAALAGGLAPQEIVEVFVQTGLYGGFGATEAAFAAAGDVLLDTGASFAAPEFAEESIDALDAAGFAYSGDLHAERSTSGYADPTDPVMADAYGIARRFGYPLVWRRPGLSLRRRILCALAGFTVLGFPVSLGKFAAAARRHGLRDGEIREAVIHACAYAGLPHMQRALRAAMGDEAASGSG